SSTISGFPASLTVNNRTISAPSNALSTLLLNYAGTGVPRRILNAGSIGANGSLQNYYSSLQVDGWNTSVFAVTDGGQLIQEGGLCVITPSVQLQNGTLNATNATMNLATLQLGGFAYPYPYYGTVCQSGGTILSSYIHIERG